MHLPKVIAAKLALPSRLTAVQLFPVNNAIVWGNTQIPIVSSKSGHIYKHNLIKKYTLENGADPITGERFTEEDEDLIPIKICKLDLIKPVRLIFPGR